MQATRWTRTVVAILAAALVVTGCASAGDEQSAAEPVPAGDSGAEGAATDGGELSATTDASGGGDDTVEAIQVGAPIGRKVIFTAALSLEADDTVTAVREIRRAVERVDGFVAAADLHRTEDDQVAGTLTLRVPSGQLDTTLDALRRIGDRVEDERIDSDDVTEEHADIEAQLRNLRALEVELLSLLAEVREKSDNAEQILAVFERVRQVRSEIERLEGRRQVLDDLVALATVEVSLAPTPAAAPLASDEWRPGEVARSALRATVAAFRVVADAAIWLTLTALPVLLLVAGLPLAVAWGVRRWRRRPSPWREAPAGGDGTSG
jgi:hypothetical protein